MRIEEAIRTAIEYEMRIRDLYAEALAEASDPVGRRIFKLMADEEDQHVRYLEERLGEWTRSGRLSSEALDTALPRPERIALEVEKLRGAVGRPGEKPRELDFLKRAREVENETSRFYETMVERLPDEGRAFFRRFLEIEAGHIALVQAEIDALNGPGFWFDMPEFELR